jgi:hypothetical protein
MGAKKKAHSNLPPHLKRDLILKEIQYELDLEIIELPMHQQHKTKITHSCERDQRRIEDTWLTW